MDENIWKNAAQATINAGSIPFPVTNTVIDLLQTIMDEKEAAFINIFTKPLNMKEIQEKSGMDDESLNQMLSNLMYHGIITGIPSKNTGVVVYRLMAPVPGIFEFTMMRGRTTEKEKKLARLFDHLFNELKDMVQDNYDPVMEYLKNTTPLTRVVPIEEEIKREHDDVIPYDDVKKIIDKFDTIAVSTCYCRHEKDLIGKPCRVTRDKENCMSFGQTAEFVIKYEFGKRISKAKAFEIMEKAQEEGLVHKAFHMKQDVAHDEYGICNCCKCCCGTFQFYYLGGAPMQTYCSHLAQVSPSDCSLCGICEEMCPMEAIRLNDVAAIVDKDKCIGCGVCAHQCPAAAIQMLRTGVRNVFIPPARRS